MHFRTQTLHFLRGTEQLMVGCEVDGGFTRYVGSIDGKRCVTSITKEGAVAALLRHHICGALNAGEVL